MSANRRNGFTLVEVLIVVVIMAVLAATIIPQFSDSTKDAKISTATFNLSTLRSQIEMYKTQHDGKAPSASLAELTGKTDATGAMTGSGPFPYGPYLREIPTNPLNNKSTIEAVTTDPTSGDGSHGWIYNTNTGGIWLDDATLYSK
jgi:general secretion pathway protein G